MAYPPRKPHYHKSLKQLRNYDIVTALGIIILAYGFLIGLFFN